MLQIIGVVVLSLLLKRGRDKLLTTYLKGGLKIRRVLSGHSEKQVEIIFLVRRSTESKTHL
jgi:hypothetical protein